jgi:hypothetical protein
LVAQDGADVPLIGPAQEALAGAVKERLTLLNPDEVSVAFASLPENVVQVQVTYPFEFVAPIVAQITGESIEMSSSASMIAH